jgi:hypothetical protein
MTHASRNSSLWPRRCFPGDLRVGVRRQRAHNQEPRASSLLSARARAWLRSVMAVFPSMSCTSWDGSGTSTSRIPVHCVRSGQILETLVQVERAVRCSGPLLIRGFGVRVPGGAPVFYLVRQHTAPQACRFLYARAATGVIRRHGRHHQPAQPQPRPAAPLITPRHPPGPAQLLPGQTARRHRHPLPRTTHHQARRPRAVSGGRAAASTIACPRRTSSGLPARNS